MAVGWPQVLYALLSAVVQQVARFRYLYFRPISSHSNNTGHSVSLDSGNLLSSALCHLRRSRIVFQHITRRARYVQCYANVL